MVSQQKGAATAHVSNIGHSVNISTSPLHAHATGKVNMQPKFVQTTTTQS